FRHFRHALVALHDATADKPQKMFNRQTTVRGSFIAITGEHLGQAIAYARMNGVVPPWTEGFRAATDQPRPELSGGSSDPPVIHSHPSAHSDVRAVYNNCMPG